ncbi:MAG TPA: HWE histidine kinase domain-containing protein [Caulobacteraceae bacterium]|jgi:PAS domain S-box-containing protein
MDDAEVRAVNAKAPADGQEAEPRARGDAPMDSAPDPRFDRFAKLAALIFDTPRAAVILTKSGRLCLKGKAGSEDSDWRRRGALVEATLAAGETIFCTDPAREPLFAGIEAEALAGLRFCVCAPLATADGGAIGALCIADVTAHDPPSAAQRAALADLVAMAGEEAVRATASRTRAREFDIAPLQEALKAADLGVLEWDVDADTVLLSERLKDMLGAPCERIPSDWGGGFDGLVHPDDREAARAAITEGLQAKGRFEVSLRLVRPSDGSVAWVSCAGVMVKEDADYPGRVVCIVHDITPRKLGEQQRETLVAELDHRIKNVLAAVQSLAAQSARKAISLEAFLKTFTGRLKSMASAHQLLTATRWRGASMSSVAAAELGGIAPGQTRWEGPELLLTPRAAAAMSLALHELAINAVKFGALSVETGRIDVRWLSLPDGGLELQWAESFGPRVTPRTRRGFGATLLEEVTGRDLGGEVSVDFRREGVRAVIRAGIGAITAPSVLEPEPQSEPAAASEMHAPAQPYSAGAARIDGLRLLIVEDALLLALELEAGLEEAGATIVGSAADVEEAMTMVDRPLDAAVLDANLNGASVMPVAEALAARGIPFVFATGYGDSRFNFAGFDAPVIRKPYDVTQVTAALAEVTGRV